MKIHHSTMIQIRGMDEIPNASVAALIALLR